MRNFIVAAMAIVLCVACSNSEEGLIGEWEGTTERVNSDGNLILSNISCIIKSESGAERNVKLSVGGTNYEFNAHEQVNVLIYEKYPLGVDSTIRSYISGRAELMNDTLLHFEHDVYAMKNNALLYSDRFELDMTRK